MFLPFCLVEAGAGRVVSHTAHALMADKVLHSTATVAWEAHSHSLAVPSREQAGGMERYVRRIEIDIESYRD